MKENSRVNEDELSNEYIRVVGQKDTNNTLNAEKKIVQMTGSSQSKKKKKKRERVGQRGAA